MTAILSAVRDPSYHRYLIFGKADLVRQRALDRPLRVHEMQTRLPEPQRVIVERVERAIRERKGEVITVRMARQTGKNETEAFLANRALMIWQGVPGSVWVRTAPTYRPQIVNSKLRLEKFIGSDPFIKRKVRPREGYIIEVGQAQVQFLSGGAQANVLGATASIALSVDEAHKIDSGKFEEEFAPFTASTNAPTILWGVAADKLDLLYEYRSANDGTDKALDYPAKVWCNLNEAYAAHYLNRVEHLGRSHPVILTQYDLVDVEAVGSYLNAGQRSSLFSGTHPRLEAPRDGQDYAMLVDIGGESEVDADDEDVRFDEPARDSTWVWILEWTRGAQAIPYPTFRIVAAFWWTGRDHMSLLPELEQLARRWRVLGGACDARGVGEAVALGLHKRIPGIAAYKASSESVSEDCYDLLARLNVGTVQFWKADPADDEIVREFHAQARHTKYEIHGHQLMRLIKPTGTSRKATLHIDGMKALTYLHRGTAIPHAGLFGYASTRLDLARKKQENRDA